MPSTREKYEAFKKELKKIADKKRKAALANQPTANQPKASQSKASQPASSQTRGIKQPTSNKPIPDKMKKKTLPKPCSEAEKKRRQARKLEYANKVGWQQRKGSHRHAHQERREKEFINYMHGVPLDYDMDSD